MSIAASAAGRAGRLGGQLGGRVGTGDGQRLSGRLARVSVQERGLLRRLAAVEAVLQPFLQNREIFFFSEVARLKDAKNVCHLL